MVYSVLLTTELLVKFSKSIRGTVTRKLIFYGARSLGNGKWSVTFADREFYEAIHPMNQGGAGGPAKDCAVFELEIRQGQSLMFPTDSWELPFEDNISEAQRRAIKIIRIKFTDFDTDCVWVEYSLLEDYPR